AAPGLAPELATRGPRYEVHLKALRVGAPGGDPVHHVDVGVLARGEGDASRLAAVTVAHGVALEPEDEAVGLPAPIRLLEGRGGDGQEAFGPGPPGAVAVAPGGGGGRARAGPAPAADRGRQGQGCPGVGPAAARLGAVEERRAVLAEPEHQDVLAAGRLR